MSLFVDLKNNIDNKLKIHFTNNISYLKLTIYLLSLFTLPLMAQSYEVKKIINEITGKSHCTHHHHHHSDPCSNFPGPQGPQGPEGASGIVGPAGIAVGTIIPFASGNQITLVPGNTVSILGFGNSVNGIIPTGTLDTSTVTNFAFSVPRDCTLTSFAAWFTGGDTVVQAQVWESTTPNNVFTPIASTLLNLAPSRGIVSGLAYPLTAGTRLLVTFSTQQNAANGYASAGIALN